MRNTKKPTRIVLTGGPGRGKTTLIEVLAARGFRVIPEMARMVIEEEQKKDSDCLPWMNLYAFQEKVARLQLEQEHSYEGDNHILDRGIIDGHGYSLMGEIQTPGLITQIGSGRYPLVLLLDELPFYKNDSARKETKEEGRRAHGFIKMAYQEFGYNTFDIPFVGTPEKRADYVMGLLEAFGV
jgi:predicted ATPase